MRHLKMLALCLIYCVTFTLTIPTEAQEVTYGKACLRGGHELFIDGHNVRALREMPVTLVPWQGSKTVFENGQRGWDIPLPAEMTSIWYIQGKTNGRDYVLFATTHPDTPDLAYIWMLPLDQTTDRNGEQLGNHPICDLYTTPLSEARKVK
jgi:hypothetical protein